MMDDRWKQDDDEEAIQALLRIQEKLNILEEERCKSLAEIEKQFSEKRRPLYEERQRISSLVNNFWYHVLCSHPFTAALMTEEDRAVLQYLEDIFITETDDNFQGYQINLKFAPNEHIEDKVIWKQVRYADDLQGWKGIVSGIRWKKPLFRKGELNTESTSRETVSLGCSRSIVEETEDHAENSLLHWFETEQVADDMKEVLCEDIWKRAVEWFIARDKALVEDFSQELQEEVVAMEEN